MTMTLAALPAEGTSVNEQADPSRPFPAGAHPASFQADFETEYDQFWAASS